MSNRFWLAYSFALLGQIVAVLLLIYLTDAAIGITSGLLRFTMRIFGVES